MEEVLIIVKRLQDISDFMKYTGKPAFLAHPFRSAVCKLLINNDIEPWITEIEYRAHWSDFDYSEVRQFFYFDIQEVACTAKELGIPLEVNGGTHTRIRMSNMPAVMQMLWCAYKEIIDTGAELAVGSDLHRFKTSSRNKQGQYVPHDCFEALGIQAKDIGFVERLMAK